MLLKNLIQDLEISVLFKISNMKKDIEHEFVKQELSLLMEITLRLEDELNNFVKLREN